MNNNTANVKAIFGDNSIGNDTSHRRYKRVNASVQAINNDNLCCILGINRAIEYLLNQKEVATFEQLSLCSPDFISSVTDRAMTAYSNTWVHQAQLAKKGKWCSLSVYQYHIRLKTAGKVAYDEV